MINPAAQGFKQMNAKRPKVWSVNVISGTVEPLSIFCDGRPLTQTAPATVDNVSPVEYLLIAAGSCFALSCRAVLAGRHLPRVPFEVVATGEKALDSPSRLTSIALVVIFRSAIAASDAVLIAEEAKLLCTVTNTILGSPTVAVTGRAMR